MSELNRYGEFPEAEDIGTESLEHLTNEKALKLAQEATDEAKEKARQLIRLARTLNLNEN